MLIYFSYRAVWEDGPLHGGSFCGGVICRKVSSIKDSPVYSKHWVDWCSFVEATMECQGDPLLSGWSEQDKAGLLALFLSRRYERGLRGKQATSVTASIHLHFIHGVKGWTSIRSRQNSV